VRDVVQGGPPRPAVTTEPARCAQCVETGKTHAAVHRLMRVVVASEAARQVMERAVRGIWDGRGRTVEGMKAVERKWRQGSEGVSEAVEEVSDRLRNRAGAAAEAVLGAMGFAVGMAGQRAKTESMRDFVRRRVGRAEGCRCEHQAPEQGLRRCTVKGCGGWRMRPRDQLRHAARQHRRCDKPACAVREEVPTTPCARCQRATHEQCRTEKQVRHRAEEGQSICRRCGDTDETAEECVALSCVTGAMRCLVCRRGVCPQHNVRQHIGTSAPCCMKCLVGMLAATADYTELQCAVAVQAVRARTSLSPVRSVGLMQRGREAGAEARRREQLK